MTHASDLPFLPEREKPRQPDLAYLRQLRAAGLEGETTALMLENAWSYIHWLEDALAAFMAEERAERARLAVETIGESFDPRGYFVYLLFGEDDARPIYVGQSSNVLSRLGNHMSANDRRGRVTRVGLIRCADDRQMFALERELIEHYRPELNVRLVPVEDQSAASRAPWMPHDLDGKIALGASVPRVF